MNQLKLKTSRKLPTVLKESIEYTQTNKEKPKDHNV